MDHEKHGEDDQKSLSKEERKQKKEEKRKKKKERLKEKKHSSGVDQVCDHAAQDMSPEIVTKHSKKKHKTEKQKKHSSGVDQVCDHAAQDTSPEIVTKHSKKKHKTEKQKSDHSINGDGKIKRQKTDSIEQTTRSDASIEKIKPKRKKSKKEKTSSKDQSIVINQLSGVCQDITVKKENTKSDIVLDGENVMPVKIDSTLHNMDCGINHEIKSKKQIQVVHSNKDGKTKDNKNTDRKRKQSSPTKEEHSEKKKEMKSKHKDFESADKTDSKIHRKKHKKKYKSTCCAHGSDKYITDEHDSMETQDEKHSKKKKKNHSKNSQTAMDMVNNINGKQEICSEVSKHGKTTSEQIKSEQNKNKNCAAVSLGNWQGNLFESNERQNKFLRLLGGMKKSNDTAGAGKGSATLASTKKKSLFGSLAFSNTTSSGKGVALNVDAAASLNQNLEDQYNKAMNFKLSGKVGTGFGFAPDPTEGKKFHIDVNKSKSVKFDDN